jgi:L-seryl-tRNA(Ser) seleniumtransferase
MSSVFRGLPSVNELLESPPLKSLVKRIHPSVVVSGVQQFLDGMRHQVQSAAAKIPPAGELAQRIAEWIAAERPRERPAINATGVLLSRDLGAPPLADPARNALDAAAGDYAVIDSNPAGNETAPRGAEAERLVARLTGSEAALVAGSFSGAQLLALAAIASGREVIVSRGQLWEAADGSRIVDLLSASGAELREVGASNKTRLADFTEAITQRTAALLSILGESDNREIAAQPPLGELAALGRRHNLPVIQLLGDGSLVDLATAGLKSQPVAADSLQAGVDLVILSGSDCVGGPECGLIAGRRSLIEKIAAHPLARALSAGRLTRAALAATLRLYDDAAARERSIPFFSLLTTPLENLKHRAERLAPQLAATGVGRVEVSPGETTLRGAAAPGETLPTWRLAIVPANGDAETLAASLRAGHPAVVGRIESSQLLLDLRTVFPRQDTLIAAAFEALRTASTPGTTPTGNATTGTVDAAVPATEPQPAPPTIV